MPGDIIVSTAPNTQRRDIARDRIVKAATGLLRDEGPAAVTTRRVAQEAGLQPPALYRFFQGKDDLLVAAVEQVFADHVARKQTTEPLDDPVEDLRAGWNTQIGFGLAPPRTSTACCSTRPARATPRRRPRVCWPSPNGCAESPPPGGCG